MTLSYITDITNQSFTDRRAEWRSKAADRRNWLSWAALVVGVATLRKITGRTGQ